MSMPLTKQIIRPAASFKTVHLIVRHAFGSKIPQSPQQFLCDSSVYHSPFRDNTSRRFAGNPNVPGSGEPGLKSRRIRCSRPLGSGKPEGVSQKIMENRQAARMLNPLHDKRQNVAYRGEMRRILLAIIRDSGKGVRPEAMQSQKQFTAAGGRQLHRTPIPDATVNRAPGATLL